jgi:predicted nucleic acid-binding protein
MIIDASVLLSAFFPDESQAQAQAILHAHATGLGRLKAPTLMIYEITNAVWQAERRGRISSAETDEIIQTVVGLDIELLPLEWGEMLPLARQYERSAYDAAYLTLAQRTGEALVTGDKRLYNAVKGDLDWVVWMGDYKSE